MLANISGKISKKILNFINCYGSSGDGKKGVERVIIYCINWIKSK